jgi:hypothetical protein
MYLIDVIMVCIAYRFLKSQLHVLPFDLWIFGYIRNIQGYIGNPAILQGCIYTQIGQSSISYNSN